MELKESKSYKLKVPTVRGGEIRIHIDKIMKNVTTEDPDSRLVVYRYWRKYKQCWKWHCDELWELQLLNEDSNLIIPI